jgi:tetratricopeptide (TPR) repeat protein
VREGINVVTSGSIDRSGDGYEVSIRAVDATTGKTIAEDREKASSKDAVLATVARLAAKVRRALGDATPESTQLAAAETFTAGSLEAGARVRGRPGPAVGRRLGGGDPPLPEGARPRPQPRPRVRGPRRRREQPRAAGRRREELQGGARAHRPMSEREKYRTRGGYYLLIRNPDNAIDEFTSLVKQFPADTAGIANLAFAYFVKRDMANALLWGRRAIEIYPKNVPQRNNFGLIAMYAGDFETGVREQRTVLQMNPQFVLAYVGLALSELGAGRPQQALETWNRLAAIGPAWRLFRRGGARRPGLSTRGGSATLARSSSRRSRRTSARRVRTTRRAS